MRNKGYTLIELLGVMIILALLLSLVIPSVINVIKSSTEKSDNLVNDLVIDATELYMDDYSNEFYEIYGNTYCIPLTELVELNYLKENIEYEGKDITDTKSVKISYTDKYNYEIVDNDTCTKKLITYNNGQEIYFDVEKGTGCTKEEYESSYDLDAADYLNSKTGYNGFVNISTDGTSSTEKLEKQNSCLKFYAFNNDSKSKTISLLLDHNTTAKIAWNSSDSNTSGPSEVITQLKTDTSSWNGTITPSNYTVFQTSGVNYTIKYRENDYKARLITANEVAKITSNFDFDESITTYSQWFYFDTNTTTQSETCQSGNISSCNYGWLYDRTGTNCLSYGCLNKSEIAMDGYWTATIPKDSNYSWVIHRNSYFKFSNITKTSYGVRPVIEVLKTNL